MKQGLLHFIGFIPYLLLWWLIGCLLTLLFYKLDKKPVFVKDARTVALLGLFGLLTIVIWLITRVGTWMENHQDKRIL